MIETVGLDRMKTRFLQILESLFLAPHSPQAFAPLSQGDSHTVHARDGVEQGSDGMLDVLVHMACPANVLHQINSL